MSQFVDLAEEFVATESEDVVIDGVHVWRATWRRTGQKARMSHYGRRITAPVYEASEGGKHARFAAVEASNGGFVFGIPRRAA